MGRACMCSVRVCAEEGMSKAVGVDMRQFLGKRGNNSEWMPEGVAKTQARLGK